MTWRAKATFSVTVLFGSSRKSWKTVPIWRRIAGIFQLGSRLSSLPATNTLPLRGALFAQDQPQKRRLARARGADQEDELALLDIDIDVLERCTALAVVGLGYIFKTNHGVASPEIDSSDALRTPDGQGRV